jgi:hypothetical protein
VKLDVADFRLFGPDAEPAAPVPVSASDDAENRGGAAVYLSGCLCGACTRRRCGESGLDAGAGEGVAEDAEHNAGAGVAVTAVKPAGVADQPALPGVEVDGLLLRVACCCHRQGATRWLR